MPTKDERLTAQPDHFVIIQPPSPPDPPPSDDALISDAGPDHSDSAMLALIPVDEDAEKLAVGNGLPREELHVTLAFLGDVADLSTEALEAARTAAQTAATEPDGEVEGVTAGRGSLGQEDPPASVLFLNGEAMEQIHASIWAQLQEYGVENFHAQHRPWIPHMTIGYGTPDEDMPDAGVIRFDRIRYVAGGDVEDYTLSGATLAAGHMKGEIMPWTVQEQHAECPSGEPWGVVNTDTDELEDGGCHASRAEAEEHVAALYAAEGVDDGGSGRRREEDATPGRTFTNRSSEFWRVSDQAAERLSNMIQRLQAEGEETERQVAPWSGVLVVEGITTGDGREFAPEALDWGELPIPLRWQKEGAHGGDHDVTVTVGLIEAVWRDGEKVMGAGHIDLANPDGAEINRRMEAGYPGGISIDADDISDADIEFVWPEDDVVEGEEDDGDILMMLFAMPEKVIFHGGRIRAATLVDIPAFVEAKIELISDDEYDSLVSANAQSSTVEPEAPLTAAAFKVVDRPPAAWFANPMLSVPTPITVSEAGRVYGHAAPWGECHIGQPDVCVTLPHEDDHPYFMTGEIETSDGTTVSVGSITLGTGHAPMHYGARPAAEHYDNTGTVVADVAVGNDRHGLWVAGAVRPGTDERRVRELRGAGQLSGDWRRIGGSLRLVGLLAVNVPGFPVPKMRAMTAGAIGQSMVVRSLTGLSLNGLVARGTSFLSDEDEIERRVAERLAQRDEAAERRDRLAALRAKVHG